MFVLILSTVLIQMAIAEQCPTPDQLATGSGCGSVCDGSNTQTYLKLNDTECTGCVDCYNWSLQEDGNCPAISCTMERIMCEGGESRNIDSYFKAEGGKTCQLCDFKGCW